tara:strand:- start:14667 stop:14948 length:282 start_codon:yes stop_codon:yes gene_type:complete
MTDPYGTVRAKILDLQGKARKDNKNRVSYSQNGELIVDTCMDDTNNPIMESLYLIRYLKEDSTQITKTEYDSLIASGGTAYIAAFVGCTYHCG